MPLFWMLLAKVIPLYGNLVLGFIAGKWLGVDRDSVSRLMLYLISPIVFFGGLSRMEITPVLLTVPLLGYLLASTVSAATYYTSRCFYKDSRPNIMAAASGTGNNGYFGLPIAMALFDTQTVGIYLMLVVGISVYESSLGFYITAKGQHTPRESLIKTLRLPTLYAFLAGAVCSMMTVPLPDAFYDFTDYFKGAYTVLGMMQIGLGLSTMKRFRIDIGFTSILLTARFLLWPLLVSALVWIDVQYLHWYSDAVRRAVVLISFMPLAANTVSIAAILRCHPEEVATAVLISTVIAAFYVPFMVSWLL